MNFSNEKELLGVLSLKKNRDDFITSMTCFADLTVHLKELSNYDKVKKVLD